MDSMVTLEVLGATFIVGLLVLSLSLKLGRSDAKRCDQKSPVLGNLPLLGPLLHQDFKKLSDRYGPILHLRLGSVTAIVISSPALAEEVLKAKDMTFASRPTSSSGTIVFKDHSNVGFSPYGPYWRHARKVFTLELMTVKRIRQFEGESFRAYGNAILQLFGKMFDVLRTRAMWNNGCCLSMSSTIPDLQADNGRF